jgi:hypothetical protein
MSGISRQLLRPDDAVDMHMHTIASDGDWTPEQLIDYLAERAFRRELDVNINDFEANLQLGHLRRTAQRFDEASAYLEREVRARWLGTCKLLLSRPMVLAEFGIVDQSRLRSAWQAYLSKGGANQAGAILQTLQAELWLVAAAGNFSIGDRAAATGSRSVLA